MKYGVTAGRILSYAWKNFTRNAWLGVATVFILVLSLLSVNTLVGVNALVDSSARILEDRIDISVFFSSGTPDALLEQARFFMASLPQVKNVTLLSPDDSLATFQSTHSEDPDILAALDELDGNPLGASLIIKAHQTKDYPFLLEALKNPQFDFAVETKSYDDHSDAIMRIRDIGRSARLFGAFLIAIFVFFSVLIVYNAVRVAIYTQREEIGIMRLVGASGSFVRAPFVMEGVLLAVIALVISAAIIWIIIVISEPRLILFFDGADPGLRQYFMTNLSRLILIEGGGLLLIVATSSWAAVGKHLKR